MKAYEGFLTSLCALAAAVGFYVLVYIAGYSTFGIVLIHAAVWLAAAASAFIHLRKREGAAQARSQLMGAQPSGVPAAGLLPPDE